MKKTFISLLVMLTCCWANAQRTYVDMDVNTINMSNATPTFTHGSGVLISANSADGIMFRLLRVEYNGDTAWAKWYVNPLNANWELRCLKVRNVKIGSNDRWLILGYQQMDPTGRDEALVMLLDDNGNVLNANTYPGAFDKTHALDVVQSSDLDHFYVVGHSKDSLTESHSGSSEAFLFKIEHGLSLVDDVWLDSGTPPSRDYDMAEDIIIADSGVHSGPELLFVSGSRNVDADTGNCRVMALFIEDNGTSLSVTDASFDSPVGVPAFRQAGADAMKDGDTVYLVWNCDYEHTFNILPFDIPTRTPVFTGAINFIPGALNGGHHIYIDHCTPNHFRVYGYWDDCDDGYLRPFYASVPRSGTGPVYSWGSTQTLGRPEWQPQDFYSLFPYYLFSTPPQGMFETSSNYTSDFTDPYGMQINCVYYQSDTGINAIDWVHLNTGVWSCGEQACTWTYLARNFRTIMPVSNRQLLMPPMSTNPPRVPAPVPYFDCEPISKNFGDPPSGSGSGSGTGLGYGPGHGPAGPGTGSGSSSGGSGAGHKSDQRSITSETSTPTTIAVFPNPASELVSVQVEGDNAMGILKVTNAMGALIWSAKVNSTTPTQIQFSNHPDGVYFITFEGESLTETHRIVKSH